jgi:hypothetical protein
MFSNNGDMVCSMTSCQTVSSSTFNILDQNTLTMSCGTCASGKRLDVFCIDSCKTYYLSFCSSLAADDTTGECARPIEDNGVCVTATADATTPQLGNSGGFKGCLTQATYLYDFECHTCVEGTGFIDQQGVNCLYKCPELSTVSAFVTARTTCLAQTSLTAT